MGEPDWGGEALDFWGIQMKCNIKKPKNKLERGCLGTRNQMTGRKNDKVLKTRNS